MGIPDIRRFCYISTLCGPFAVNRNNLTAMETTIITPPRPFRHFPILALALAAIGLATPTARAVETTIYQDSFNRAGALAGSTPDITTGGATWSGGGTTSTTGGGQLTPGGNGALPFSPVAGNVYTLSYTYNPNAAGTDANIDIGFKNPTDGNGNGRAMFYQEVRKPSQMALSVTYNGNAGVNIPDPAPNVPADYKIVLNTTQPTWTAEFFVGGVSQALVNLASPNITRVVFSMWTGGVWTDVVSNLALTQTTIPAAR